MKCDSVFEKILSFSLLNVCKSKSLNLETVSLEIAEILDLLNISYHLCIFAALSLLQNGRVPRLLEAGILEEVFVSETPRQIFKDLRDGLDSLGLVQVGFYMCV